MRSTDERRTVNLIKHITEGADAPVVAYDGQVGKAGDAVGHGAGNKQCRLLSRLRKLLPWHRRILVDPSRAGNELKPSNQSSQASDTAQPGPEKVVSDCCSNVIAYGN
jgi:hypothetical protein